MRDTHRERRRSVTKHLVVWLLGLMTPFLIGFLPAANNCGSDRAACLVDSENSKGGEDGSNARALAPPVSHNGVLKFSYQRRERLGSSVEAYRSRSSRQAIDRIVGELKNQMALPFDVNVSVEKCDGPDAFYDDDSHRVTICYELIDSFYDLFSEEAKSRAKLDESVKGATVSLFLHELGHALIDAWDLPITGREEDAADQFATLLMITRLHDGERMAFDGARSFELFANLEKGQPKFYWDAHSLDEQRFYDTVCLIYGHNPDKYRSLLTPGRLPAQRAEFCEDDYDRLRRSWQTLLSPHLKKGQLIFEETE